MQHKIHNQISCTKETNKKHTDAHKHSKNKWERILYLEDRPTLIVSGKHKPVFIYTGTMWDCCCCWWCYKSFFSSRSIHSHKKNIRFILTYIHLVCASFWIYLRWFWSANSFILYRLRAFVLRVTCWTTFKIYVSERWLLLQQQQQQQPGTLYY